MTEHITYYATRGTTEAAIVYIINDINLKSRGKKHKFSYFSTFLLFISITE